MTELIQESTLAEYEAFVQSHPKGHFAQSSLWAKQKPAWKWRAIVSRGADGRIRGSIAFLIRTMPYIHKTMLYACRGPAGRYLCGREELWLRFLAGICPSLHRGAGCAMHCGQILCPHFLPQRHQ